jgi:hypothetical protein
MLLLCFVIWSFQRVAHNFHKKKLVCGINVLPSICANTLLYPLLSPICRYTHILLTFCCLSQLRAFDASRRSMRVYVSFPKLFSSFSPLDNTMDRKVDKTEDQVTNRHLRYRTLALTLQTTAGQCAEFFLLRSKQYSSALHAGFSNYELRSNISHSRYD